MLEPGVGKSQRALLKALATLSSKAGNERVRGDRGGHIVVMVIEGVYVA
jgi:hypothetical protein